LIAKILLPQLTQQIELAQTSLEYPLCLCLGMKLVANQPSTVSFKI